MDTQGPPTPRLPMETKSEVEDQTHPVRERAFVSLDTEGTGDHVLKWPTIAVAFVVTNEHGEVRHTWQGYAPYQLGPETTEKDNWETFWTNEKKVSKATLAMTIKKCAESPYADFKAFWQAVDAELDHIYETFDTTGKRLKWITNCADYDIGRVDHAIVQHTDRPKGLRFDRATGARHTVDDCESGLDVLKKLLPDVHDYFEKRLKDANVKHDHDCLNDALQVAAKHAAYRMTVKAASANNV